MRKTCLDASRGPLSRLSVLAATVIASICVAPNVSAQEAQRSKTPQSTPGVLRTAEVVSGLDHPWGMAFLPDGRILVTEKPGRLRIVQKDGKLSAPLGGVPAVAARGQGGLLDVVTDPKFSENQYIYFSYSEPEDGGKAGTAVARAKLGANALEDVKVIFRQQPKVEGTGHFGSRIIFARDGTMFIGLGERMAKGNREQAQDLTSGLGKVMHINTDGSPAKGNPFAGRKDAQPEIWSYGHRNIQAAALNPETGELWVIEHGPMGGDELNRAQAGKNYGWPVITYGREYSGEKINGGKTAQAGMEQPTFYWDPVIAPSGMIFNTGKAFPEWKNNIFVGSLKPGGLVRLELRDGRVAAEERYLSEVGRVRDVEQGPDGLIYLLTDDSNGRLLRVERVSRKQQ